MCRMFALTGKFQEQFTGIFKALQEVAVSDPLSEHLLGKRISHDDGWGFVNYDGHDLNHFKTVEPVFKSKVPKISDGWLVVHARKAAKNEPFGPLNSHPFHRAVDKADLFLTHNGWIDKDRMKTGFDGEYIANHTDSELFLDVVSRGVGTSRNRLQKAIDSVYSQDALKSGFNLFLLSTERGSDKANIYAYTDALNYDDYHVLYFVRGDEWAGIFSSSILESKHFPESNEKHKLERKTVFELLNQTLVTAT